MGAARGGGAATVRFAAGEAPVSAGAALMAGAVSPPAPDRDAAGPVATVSRRAPASAPEASVSGGAAVPGRDGAGGGTVAAAGGLTAESFRNALRTAAEEASIVVVSSAYSKADRRERHRLKLL